MNIYKYIKNFTNIETFNDSTIVSDYIGYPKLDDFTHQSLAKSFYDENLNCYSLIVVSENLNDELRDNPKYIKITNNISVSKAVEMARTNLINKWYNSDKAKQLLEKYNVELNADNFSNEEVNKKHFRKLEDGIFDMQLQMEIFKFLYNLRENCKWEYTDEEEDQIRELNQEEFDQKFQSSLEEFLMPRTYQTYERVYDLPFPLSYWDRRNIFQQWFFVEKDDKICFVIGGSGGSMQRHLLGLYSHAFAELEFTYNKKCPTGVYIYSDRNEMKLFKEFSSHRAFAIDLVGNYKPNDKNTIDTLFKNKLLSYEINWDSGKISLSSLDSNRFSNLGI